MILGIDPKVDYAFKKVFGSESNKDLLIELIRSVLGDTLPAPISEIEIVNPFNAQEYEADKLSILDIKAKDTAGNLYLIEMQIRCESDFPRRSLYYWARSYGGQLAKTDPYTLLRRTISINFVCGVLHPDVPEYHLRFRLREEKHRDLLYCPELDIHLIELPKFLLSASDLDVPLEKWCFFLRHGDKLDMDNLPEKLRWDPIPRALEVLKVMNYDQIERERYEDRLKALKDQISRDYNAAENLKRVREESLGEGLNRGLLQARIEDIQKGMESRFGSASSTAMAAVRKISNPNALQDLLFKLLSGIPLDEFEALAARGKD